MSDHVPERYQRWEGIRERNTILSLFFGMCGHGRKQPIKFERIQLFILYASVWYLAYTMSLRRRGRPCRKAWVEACVPENMGGGCSGTGRFGNCSSVEILAASPDGFNDFHSMYKGWSSTRIGIKIDEAECVKAGHSPCSVPLCADDKEDTCVDKRDGTGGFCRCHNWGSLVFFDTVIYTILFKLLYMPFWYLFVIDLEKYCGKIMDRFVTLSVTPLYSIIFTTTIIILWRYMDSADGFAWETSWWFITFLCLCCFEVVKSFTLGFIVGSYVICPLFGPCVSSMWKFLFA